MNPRLIAMALYRGERSRYSREEARAFVISTVSYLSQLLKEAHVIVERSKLAA